MIHFLVKECRHSNKNNRQYDFCLRPIIDIKQHTLIKNCSGEINTKSPFFHIPHANYRNKFKSNDDARDGGKEIAFLFNKWRKHCRKTKYCSRKGEYANNAQRNRSFNFAHAIALVFFASHHKIQRGTY